MNLIGNVDEVWKKFRRCEKKPKLAVDGAVDNLVVVFQRLALKQLLWDIFLHKGIQEEPVTAV